VAGETSSVKDVKREQGVVLVISLVILLALTTLGIASLAGTRLNEVAASNTQQKATAFEAAESAIVYGWNIDYLNLSLSSSAPGEFDNPSPVSPAGVEAILSSSMDQHHADIDRLTVDITASVTVQYCGETARPPGSGLSADETDLGMAGLQFDVTGRAAIEGSAAVAENVQRAVIVRPRTGRTGNCVSPST
jgi:type IV pilus assembly protein PilX